MQHRLRDIKDFDRTIVADFIVKWVCPIGTAQHRATPRQQAAYVRDVQQPDLVRLDEPLEAIFDP